MRGGAWSQSPLGWALMGGAEECLTGLACISVQSELIGNIEPSPTHPTLLGMNEFPSDQGYTESIMGMVTKRYSSAL